MVGLCRLRQAQSNTGFKTDERLRTCLHESTQNAVLGVEAKELTSHPSLKPQNFSSLTCPSPLAVSPGQNATAVGRNVGAPNLRFLATHHVVNATGFLEPQARCNVKAAGAASLQVYLDGCQVRCCFVDAGRAIEVRGFFPTLSTAHHATGNQCARIGLHPISTELAQCLCEKTVFNGHHTARGASRLNGLPISIQQCSTQIGCTPVNGN